MKKIASLIGAGALLLSVSGVVLARGWHRPMGDVNYAKVNNLTSATSNTGGNSQSDSAVVNNSSGSEAEVEGGGSRSITTGNANATAETAIVANVDVGCPCVNRPRCGQCGPGPSMPQTEVNSADVYNDTVAGAGTGANAQNDSAGVNNSSGSEAEVENSDNRTIRTGNANSTARTLTVVNADLNFRHRVW